MAGRLGAQILEAQKRPWQVLLKSDTTPAGCRFFPETQHTLCEPFLSYWNKNGGLARFGYPISPVLTEQVGNGNWYGPVQYFERRRMEHHVENRGTAAEILLGLLGQTIRDVIALNSCSARLYEPWSLAFTHISFRRSLGCPLPILRTAPTSIQWYQGGMMIWVDLGAQGRKVYVASNQEVLFSEEAVRISATATCRVFDDTWDASQPAASGLTPPTGYYAPQRSFGKIWREHPDIQAQMGWAQSPERPGSTDYQAWSNGGAMVSLSQFNDSARGYAQVHAFAPDGRCEIVDALSIRDMM